MNTSPAQIDAFKELINIGVGCAAGSLNQMCGKHIQLRVPEVKIVGSEDKASLFETSAGGGEHIAAVRMSFSGGFSGSAELVFPTESAGKLVSLLTGEADSIELDALRSATLTEVGNIVLNGVLGSMMNVLGDHVVYDVPCYIEATSSELTGSMSSQGSALLLAQTQFLIGQSKFEIGEQAVTGEVNLLFGVDCFEALSQKIETLVEASAS